MSKMVKASSGGGVRLPIDIMTEILVKLPVKSLLRFKSVCKIWYRLIESPSFVSQHLHRPTADAVSPVLFRENVFILSLDDEPISVAADYEVPQPFLDSLFYPRDIFGTFNGVVIIAPSLGRLDQIVIWNPATRMYRQLPEPLLKAMLHRPDQASFRGAAFGCWCSPENPMKLKLLRILELNLNVTDQLFHEAEIYCQGTDSWRVVEAPEFPTGCMLGTQPDAGTVVLNGNIHWSAYRMNQLKQLKITVVAFDIKNEMFQEIQIPPPLSLGQYSASLVVYQECLGVVVIPGGFSGDNDVAYDDDIDVWVMKEYGRQESWTLLYTLVWPVYPSLRATGCWRNGEIVLYDIHNYTSDEVVLYDPSTGLAKDIPRNGATCNFTYKESLFSVDQWDADY